jgi:hypothetical protein
MLLAGALDTAKTASDIFASVVTSAALIVGGVWAYFRFVKERTYRPRIDVYMGGEWVGVAGEGLLLLRVRVKNIGAAVVDLRQEGTGLKLSCDRGARSKPPAAVAWKTLRVFTILSEHAWIEPGETISDDLLVRLPIDRVPIMLETRLVWTWAGSKTNIVVFARRLLQPVDSLAEAQRG